MNNKAFSYLSVLFISLFLLSELSGQAGMQRLFNADERDIINSCNYPLDGGGFYLVNFFNEPSTMQADSIGINITKHDPKGDLTWSKDYMIEDADYGNENKILDCHTLTGDSLVVVAVDATTQNSEGIKYIFKIGPEGAVAWANKISDINKSDNLADEYGSYAVVIAGTNKGTNYLGTHDSGDTIAVHVEQMDSMNMTNWSNSYHAVSYDNLDTLQTNLTLVNAIMSRDSGYVITNVVGSGNLRAGILDLDSLGAPRIATSYRIDDPVIDFDMEFSAIASTTDTGYVVAGTCLHGFIAKGFVIKLDSIYNVQWAKLIELDPTGFNIAGDVVVSETGEIVVGGKYLMGGINSGYYSLILDNEGIEINATKYTPDESVFVDLNSGFLPSIDLNNDRSDGTIHFTTTGATDVLEGLAPIWIKMEQDGAAMCHDTLALSSFNDLAISRDTLGIVISQFSERDSLEVRVESWDQYDVPVLTLQDTTYCPQDPIMYTIDATTNNAVAYAWSTGDTTPTTLVTEEGEYSVTVTMADRICFTLCDTTMVSQQDYPIISLRFDDTRYCQDKEFDLLVGSSTGTSGGIEWNNGPGTALISTSSNLAIAHEPGTLYSVTITDNCDNQADTTFVVPNYVPASNVVFGEDPRALCEFGALFISADWPEGYMPLNFLWESGETTQEIRTTEAGTFMVTITDNCGHTAASQYMVEPDDFDVPDPTVEIIGAAVNCENGFPSIVLTANGEAGRPDIGINYLWNTGSDQRQLLVTEPGTYSVVITDDCGQTVSDEVVITSEDLNIPPPSVNINNAGFNGDNCGILLIAEGESAEGIELVITQWNTGSLENELAVSQPGTYSVIVTDECGQTASADIEVTAAELDPEDPSISISSTAVSPANCTISLTAQGEAGSGLTLTQTQWNTGNLDSNISVDEPGTYEVVVTDNCGQTATSSITLTAADFEITAPEVTIVADENTMVDSCAIRLVAEHNVQGTPAFMWSTGETTQAVVADGYGVFAVTVTTCGQSAVAAFERTQDSAIRWPNIFFPQTPDHERNRSFGPQIDCPENFSDSYSLQVYNKWGKKVFESDNIADRWFGTLNNQGNFLEEDVYMFQWSYGGGEVQSGDVTLVRK